MPTPCSCRRGAQPRSRPTINDTLVLWSDSFQCLTHLLARGDCRWTQQSGSLQSEEEVEEEEEEVEM